MPARCWRCPATRRELRADDRQRPAVAVELFAAGPMPGGGIRVVDGNPVNLRSSGRCNARYRDAVVNDSVPVAHDAGGRHRPVIDLDCLLVRQRVPVEVRVAKMADIHEGERANPQPETEGGADMSPAKGKSYAWPVPGPRRQRRPPAIAAAVSPGHPGRSPNRVRRPAPAQAMVLKPTTVVERRPAPGIT